MKSIKYILTGILFGIVMVKSEAMSWYRIQEMFRFQAFHMYGIIGTAVVLGIIAVALIKKFKMKDIDGNQIQYHEKEKTYWRYILGGTLFGLGWALTGACPGPLFAQIGAGAFVIGVTILSAIAGTWVYGYFRERLPH